MVVILMGVAGSGKTTVGKQLAADLGWGFVDADDYHPPQNRAKMAAGIPLTDDDRMPWLTRLADVIREYQEQGKSLVMACSALREAYRRKLGVDQSEIRTVYLEGTRQELLDRLAARKHAFFNPNLLDSQLATLEEPSGGMILRIDRSPEELAAAIRKWL